MHVFMRWTGWPAELLRTAERFFRRVEFAMQLFCRVVGKGELGQHDRRREKARQFVPIVGDDVAVAEATPLGVDSHAVLSQITGRREL